MPIDRSYRERWVASGKHADHDVWNSPSDSCAEIHGTIVGVSIDLCNGCMRCLRVCPVDVFAEWESPSGVLVADPVGEKNCILCLVCETVCPKDAIDIRQDKGSDDTLNSLLQGSH